MVRLAIIGDIHHHFTQFDIDYFNGSSYDLLLCTGDLPFHGSPQDEQIVSRLAALKKPTLLIPGNHDCTSTTQFIAEARGMTRLASAGYRRQQELAGKLRRALDPVVLSGYSAHNYQFGGIDFCLIAGRPLSFGGPELRYRRYLEANFGVDSLQASVRRLQELIDASRSTQILFLAHNGPTGLGSNPEDIWGCDFKPRGGDYGDPDLETAITYAKVIGKNVRAVVAGHMHLTLQNGGSRQWLVCQDGTTYINAARVPRVLQMGAQTYHHRVMLRFDDQQLMAEEKLIAEH